MGLLSLTRADRFLPGVLLLSIAACGGGDGGGPTAPGVQRPFSQTISGTVSVFGTTMHALSVPRAGTMTLRLSWSSAIDLDLYLSNTTCTALYPMAQCSILASADGRANPEVMTRSVSSGEQFRIWVDNLSLSQSVNYTVTIDIQ